MIITGKIISKDMNLSIHLHKKTYKISLIPTETYNYFSVSIHLHMNTNKIHIISKIKHKQTQKIKKIKHNHTKQ